MSGSKMKHAGVVAMCIIGGGVMYSVPYFIRQRTAPLDKKEGKLTGTQRQRGMYLNSGQDAGRDPDWDPVEGKWKGYERRRKALEERERKGKPEKEETSS